MPEARLLFHCTQCGGTRYDPTGTAGHVHCAYCGSEYEVISQRVPGAAPDPRVLVQGSVVVSGSVEILGGLRLEEGASLTVDEVSDLRVEGDVHVDAGATLDLRDDLRLVRPAAEEVVRKALRRRADAAD